MPSESSLKTAQTIKGPIHKVGSDIYLSPETFARAAEWGWQNPLAFYFAGRGAVLGEVGSSVALSAMAYFNPEVVTAMYDEGVSVQGPAAAAARMMEAIALWGRDHLKQDEDLCRFVELADRLVDEAEGAALPLFVAWRCQPRVSDAAGRAAQLFQTLREWRGAVHIVGTTAAGLTPLEAILSNEGPGQAKFFGWTEPFADPEPLKARHDEAEAITDRLCAAELDRLFTVDEQAEFGRVVMGTSASLS